MVVSTIVGCGSWTDCTAPCSWFVVILSFSIEVEAGASAGVVCGALVGFTAPSSVLVEGMMAGDSIEASWAGIAVGVSVAIGACIDVVSDEGTACSGMETAMTIGSMQSEARK